MNISTKAKIYLASIINRPIVLIFNRLFGTSIRKVKRRGILWELDLVEGIDFSIFIFGFFERDTSKAIKRLVNSGDVVIDIGANIGAHTLPISKLIGDKGKVYAVEPTNYAYKKLINNLLINDIFSKNVQADQIILTNGNNKGVIHNLYSSWPLTSKNVDQKHNVHQGVLRTISGATEVSLDNYLLNNNITSLDLIKLDVDGNELGVLSGAKNVLKEMKPVIIMELAPEQYDNENDFMEVIKILVLAGYNFYSLNEKFKYPNAPLDLVGYIPKNGSINVVARVDC